jgi:hypothetical protein
VATISREDPDDNRRELTGTAKVAALLLAMNKQYASRLLKYFDEDEVKIVAQAANDLGKVGKDVVDALIEEFAHDLKHGADLTATTEKIHGLLEGVLSPDQIAALLAQTGTKSAHAVWQQLPKISEAALTQYLMKEHPQVIRASEAAPASRFERGRRAHARDPAGLGARLCAARNIVSPGSSHQSAAEFGPLAAHAHGRAYEQDGPQAHGRMPAGHRNLQ